MLIAVTGGMGAGKSLAAKRIVKLINAVHVDTDAVCRELLQKDQPGWNGVKNILGIEYITENGHIDRKKLRQAIFDDVTVRRKLEQILHPPTQERVNRFIDQGRKGNRHVVVEVPLLFEKGWDSHFDKVVAVIADRETCLRRITTRDKVSLGQAEKSLDSQMDQNEKAKRADFIIVNSGSIEFLYSAIDKVVAEIIR